MPPINLFCKKYQQHLPALPFAPFPGALGEKILSNISAKAWEAWIEMQTRIINENRLNPLDPKVRSELSEAMKSFLFQEK